MKVNAHVSDLFFNYQHTNFDQKKEEAQRVAKSRKEERKIYERLQQKFGKGD